MRRVLIALAIVAAFAFQAGPAVAQEGDGSTDTVTPSQTGEPTPPADTPTPPADTPTSPADTPTPPAETPGTGEPTPGTEQNDGSSGNNGGTPGVAKLLTDETPVDDLGSTIDGKTVKVCQDADSGTFTSGQVSAASVLDGSGISSGDIVKPFTSTGGSFGGQNWDTGKSIYNNDCTAPTDVTAPGGGTAAEACETATETETATLPEGETTEGASAAAANPECDSAVELLAIVDKVDICHSRSAQTNPYGPKRINVSVDSIIKPNGHDTHTGGVFPDDPWGDIIPPFEYDGGSYPGLNWSAEGQAFWFNNCQEPGEPPPPGEEKVDICHATSSQSNPYGPKQQNVSVNSIIDPNGHGDHTGPVFFPGATEWGDIIPPFDHDGGSFPGLNWDSDGQAIYFNNCQVPGDGEEECPEESEDEDSDGEESDEDGSVRALDDDEESDEECDEDDDDDGDDPDKSLPDTGGSPLWILLVGGMLTVFGMAILNRESMGRIGLFGPALLDVPAMPWSFTNASDAHLPVTVVKPKSHRTRWTMFGLLMLVAAAFVGRRDAK